MLPVTDVETMRKSDAETIRGGISGRELMRRAAEGIWKAHVWRGPVAVICGSGNNAGDGYALALLLFQAGIDCTVYLLREQFSEDGAYYYEKCRENGIKTRYFTENCELTGYAEIVDCIFGTGFSGEVHGIAARAIEAINASGAYVVSADINSGLNGDSGDAALCVRSDLTVSIGAYKCGHFLGLSKDVIGTLCNVDIGISLIGKTRYLTEKKDFTSVLKPRKNDSHKGVYGYVSLIGGCTEYAGAVKLANLSCAALRSGCGVARLVVPHSLGSAVSPFLLESTLALSPEQDGKMIYDPAALDRILAGQAAVAVGMGWGRSAEYTLILKHILTRFSGNVVIDADGLNTLAEMDIDILKQASCKVLLTPHLKEMERLSGYPISEIRKHTVPIAEEFAAKYRICLLLKGASTVITDGNETYLVNRGCAGMATAGSGDVLSGVLAGLLGYHTVSPLVAACGAYIAGLAGELAQQQNNPTSMIASDTVSQISQAVSQMLDCGKD